jgi:hypothetical protein
MMFVPSSPVYAESTKLGQLPLPEENLRSTQSTMAGEEEPDFLSLLEEDKHDGSPRNGDVTPADVRAFVAMAGRGNSDVVATLISYLHCANWEVKATAIEGLVKVVAGGDLRLRQMAMEAITSCLKDDDPIVKYDAWEALGAIEDGLSGWGDCFSPR